MTQAAAFTSLPPGSIIGIMGGGQLGRMLSLAASHLGLDCHIYCPHAGGPAARVSRYETVAEYEDLDAIAAFAQRCDVVTYEFENVPAQTAAKAAEYAPLAPGARALHVAQDRLVEKSFIQDEAGVDVVGFADITTPKQAALAGERFGYPNIIKTRRFGYDGKGQIKVERAKDMRAAFNSMNGAPLILEAFAPFTREVSIVAARGRDGTFAAYPLIENVHRNHILHTSTVPASDDDGRAAQIAQRIMDGLDYVGVMATEFFQMQDGSLLVNEIAPRVHNSGHLTQDAGCIDQFEQHIRAVAGWPLGSTAPKHGVVMTNLIGDDAASWEMLAAQPDMRLHLYGKIEMREGRKMGHVNMIGKAL
ncbi:5-(carboxyamino)imidazole ribonucleotide synthase [Robiginitomaculum antarcticum]|uniref:5-(carboxyamino)imidazole ribonucleotide synthase n=1 Tax=Robiginitomaculum antarcticum TaxID=437507 RepID=UPI00035D2940|nr:5-(carboxyamino)imidazole ribonucleotide synthase [Robiginitomaculum antarcticum]